jgi:glutathione S-transferase
MFGAKAQIACLEKGLPINLVMVPFTMDHRYEPKHPEVLRINPKRQVPVLVHGEVEIFDSTQIFEYLEHLQPQPGLWPADPAAQDAIAHAQQYYAQMDAILQGRKFLAGDYTYADIAFYMAQLFAARLGAPMNAATPHLLCWRERLTARPAVNQVVRQFADTLTRYKLRIPEFIERAMAASGS